METCKNCGNSFEEWVSYCPYCGQSTDDKLSFKVLFHNTITNYFSVDARFFRSFVPLMVKPGFLPKNFVGGKRLTYLHPAQTYLFVSVIFFFIFSFVSREQQQKIDSILQTEFNEEERQKLQKDSINQMGIFISDISVKDSLNSSKKDKNESNFNFYFFGNNIKMNTYVIDSLIAEKAPEEKILEAMGMPEDVGFYDRKIYEQTLKIYKQKGGGILQAFYDTLPITMFFLLPVFALLLNLFYFRKGPFSHHLVFSFYYFSFLFLLFALLLSTNLIWNTPGWIDSLLLFSSFIYLIIGVKKFYGQSCFMSFLKSSAVSFLFFVLVIPVTVMFMLFAAFMFY